MEEDVSVHGGGPRSSRRKKRRKPRREVSPPQPPRPSSNITPAMGVRNFVVPGLPKNLSNQSVFEKVLYTSTFLICLFISISFCLKSFIEYAFSNKALTTFYVNQVSHLPLPDVTICPLSRFDQLKLTENNVSEDLARYMQFAYIRVDTFLFDKQFLFQAQYDHSIWDWEDEISRMVENRIGAARSDMNYTFDLMLSRLGFKCHDLFSHCCVDHFVCRPCCAFADTVMSHYGNCFKFGGFNQTTQGYGRGVAIFLNIPRDREVPAADMTNEGVLLKLTEPKEYFDNDAIYAAPGRHTIISIDPVKHEMLDRYAQYGCRDTSKDIVTHGAKYGPLKCYYSCSLNPALEACKCWYVGLEPTQNLSQYESCRPARMLNCVYGSLGNYYQEHKTFLHECRRKCPPRCKYFEYQTTITYADYPSTMGSMLYPDEFDEKKASRFKHFVIEVFYERLEYAVIKQIPKTSVDQMIADIGGVIGLWIGASAISMIHLLQALVRKLSNRRTKATSTTDRDNQVAEITAQPSSLDEEPVWQRRFRHCY